MIQNTIMIQHIIMTQHNNDTIMKKEYKNSFINCNIHMNDNTNESKLKIINYKDESIFLSKQQAISLERIFNIKYPRDDDIQSLADLFYTFYVNPNVNKNNEILITNHVFKIITDYLEL